MRQHEWLQHLEGLVPLHRVREVAMLPEDSAELADFQQTVWLAHGVLRSLHIEQEFRSLFPLTNDRGQINWAHVLDVGCGSAMKARFLLENGAAIVTGVDYDEEELALARRLPNPWGDALNLHQIDVLEPLPFTDKSFDLVLICDGYIDFYARNVFEEFVRVTRPGGQIALVTTNLLPAVRYAHDRSFASRIEAARWASLADTTYAELAASGGNYEARFLQICNQFGFKIGHIPIERRNPVTPAFEHLVQQTFACFDAHILRDNLSARDWRRLCELHDPHSPRYIFNQSDALFVDMLTVAIKFC